MRFVFKLPDVAEGTAEAEISLWHVKVGDRVAEDQALVDVMTDKATVEIPSPVAGIVVSLLGSPGDKVAVGSEFVVFEIEEKEKISPSPSVPARQEPPAAAAAPLSTVSATPKIQPLASPSVRHRARALGIDLAQIHGSGPKGRLSAEDLEAFVAERTAPQEPEAVKPSAAVSGADGVTPVTITGLRRRIAERMQEAKRRIPHFSYIEEVDVTGLEELRNHLNAGRSAEGQIRLSVLPFIVRALVRAFPGFPQINARFDDDAGIVRLHEQVHVGIATQTPQGLVVPVLRNAERRDLWECAAEVARLAKAARAGKATRDELSGSTITVTTLGKLGGVATTPVINYPEVAIVGVNRIIERPVVRGGQIVARLMMNLSCSFDHRVVDGWDAAQFVNRIKAYLEHPATLFMEAEKVAASAARASASRS